MENTLAICIYCGDVMGGLTKEQIKRFGKPSCCGYDMLQIDSGKLHIIVRAMDKLKLNIEKEILKDVM